MEKLRSRGWCLTVNNYTENDVKSFEDLEAQYIICGRETASTGTKHLQTFIYFSEAKTFSKIKKLFNTAHIEPMKGTPQQASDYCKKENDYFEKGTLPLKQGKRTDLDEIREVIKTTGKMSEVVMIATSYQSVKMAEQILKYHEIKREWKPTVYWFWGSTGTGKSKTAHEMFPDAYVAMSTAKWWDGYDAHENIIIDDMRKDFCKFHELLRYLDRYSMTVETKGGTRQFLARNIVITSCYQPQELFETREDINQLLRRIDEIRKFE